MVKGRVSLVYLIDIHNLPPHKVPLRQRLPVGEQPIHSRQLLIKPRTLAFPESGTNQEVVPSFQFIVTLNLHVVMPQSHSPQVVIMVLQMCSKRGHLACQFLDGVGNVQPLLRQVDAHAHYGSVDGCILGCDEV